MIKWCALLIFVYNIYIIYYHGPYQISFYTIATVVIIKRKIAAVDELSRQAT